MADRPFDERSFRQWYAQMAEQHGLNPDPDAAGQFYDYRAAFLAGARPDETGHWPSDFKTEGHPRMVVGGFNVQTGAPSGPLQGGPMTLQMLGWDPETAATLGRGGSDPVPSHLTLRDLQRLVKVR